MVTSFLSLRSRRSSRSKLSSQNPRYDSSHSVASFSGLPRRRDGRSWAVRPTLDQAGPLQHLKVLGDGLDRDRKRLGQLIDRRLTVRKSSRIARRVGRRAPRTSCPAGQPNG
jgi:hypothetical protein